LTLLVVCGDVVRCEHDETCPNACFCDSVSRYVHCEGNGLVQKLPKQVSRTAQRLELRDFQLGSLKWENTRDSFPTSLLELSIRNSEVTELANGTFVTLIKLNNLDVSHNNLHLIQQGTFDQLLSLRHLDLGWNELREVKGTFLMLKNLETLDISNNKLEVLSLKTFSGLQRLQWLDVSHNRVSKIEPGTFLPTPSLERVVLGHNPLTSLQRLEFLGARLRYMDVSHMKLRRAPESLGPSVRELRAIGNELSTVQRGDLDGYPSLTVLDLSANRLTNVEDDALGRLEFLARVWFNENKLEQIPASLPRSLRELYLDRNKIRVIAITDLQGLPRLQRLSLRHNKLTILSSELLGLLPGLRILDLAQNPLKSATFGPTGLEELNLSENLELALKPTAFSSVPHLRTLFLSNITQSFGPTLKELLTPLSELEMLNLAGSVNLTQQALQAEVWYGLHELNLQNTSLTCLPGTLWHEMGKLRVLYLSDNPWNCSADDLQFQVSTSKMHVADAANLKCEYPETLRGSSLVISVNKQLLLSNVTTTTPPAETSTVKMRGNVTKQATPPPSLAPTRVQIAPPTSTQPQATTKPESTAPLRVDKSENQVDKNVNKLVKKTTKTEQFRLIIITSTTQKPNVSSTTLTNSSPNVTRNASTDVTHSTLNVTDVAPVDYEELAAVIEDEEFYEEPGTNFTARQLELSSRSPHAPNVPVGFLSVLGACLLGGILVGVYHCRQQRKWQRLQQQDEVLAMDVLHEPQRW
jgi:Leucine-rich repeat (LRR) protein